MQLIEIVNGPWAIVPNKLSEISAIYEAHLRGEKINLQDVEAQLGRPLAREQQGYVVQDGVAIIPVDGVIAQRANLFSRISGGASSQLIERDIRGALADTAVRGIVLEINSPGGTVAGTQELASLVDRARAEKPIVTFAIGEMASAAYWIGAAADRLYVSGDNVFVGSIGVVATHLDRSKLDEQMGVKRTEIVSGKFKRVASESAPLSKEGRASMQEMTDYLYSVFVGEVAAYRGVSVDRVLSEMADGRVFIGQQAVDVGLVDGVSTLDEVIASIGAGRLQRRGLTAKRPVPKAPAPGGAPGEQQANDQANAGGAPAAADDQAAAGGAGASSQQASDKPSNPGENMKLTRAQLEADADYAAILASIRAEGLEAGRVEGTSAGAKAERERILAVEAQHLPGHTELVSRLKADGKTTGPEAAAAVLAAEKARAAGRLGDLSADGQHLNRVENGASSAGGQGGQGSGGTDEEKRKAKWEGDANLRAEFADSYAAYVAYEKNVAAGNVKVLGKKAA